MRAVPFLTGALSQLHRRQTYDNGQYTVVPTLVSWSESEVYISYGSTEIITSIVTVPCPVFTSYTTITTTDCPEHCDEETVTICDPKSCTSSGEPDDIISTEYTMGEGAPATVTGPGVSYMITLDAESCSQTATFDPNGDSDGLPVCDDVVPPPQITCIASPCLTTSVIETGHCNCDSESTVTYTDTTDYPADQNALVTAEPPEETPASLCVAFTSPLDGNFGVEATAQCGAADDGGGEETCTTSVITYTYVSSGATIAVVTTLPQHCGPYLVNNGHSGASRVDVASVRMCFWAWCVAAALSGVGMVVL